jgi:hypothetical protein
VLRIVNDPVASKSPKMMSMTPEAFSTMGSSRRNRENVLRKKSKAKAEIKNGMASPAE